MSILVLVKLSYFVAATLFLLGLQRMASPKTARSGIQWAGVGMLIATVATFFLPGLHNIALMLAAIVIGVGLNGAWGRKVAITEPVSETAPISAPVTASDSVKVDGTAASPPE